MKKDEKIILDYDKVLCKKIDGEKINYGIIYGNEKIVFIKRGAGGNPRSFRGKYLEMAHRAHKRIGATVICASNSENPDKQHEIDKEIISKVALENNLTNYDVYLFGVSDGAYQNLILGTQIPQTVKFVGVSTSRKTLADFKNRVMDLSDVKKIFVYGTEDYEYDNIPTLNELSSDNLRVITISGADHDFNGMIEKFIELIDLL